MILDRNNIMIENEFADIDSKKEWHLLYQRIRKTCLDYDYTFAQAKKEQNMNLNRYRDVSPYDHSRVVLKTGPCDYINANIVKVDTARRKYILAQGPLPHTTGHFWLMVWEQNSRAVIMLNKVIEKNQVKCHQYWPLGKRRGGHDTVVFDDVHIQVTHIGEIQHNYYIIRALSVTHLVSGESRDILHFHYTTWPDFGVPQSPGAFLQFLQAVRESGALEEDVGPAVVHCSAGIGRSGTFCLVDSCLLLIEKNGAECVSATQVLLEMRRYRMGLIQTPDQLRFSYQAIVEGAHRLREADGVLQENRRNGVEIISKTGEQDEEEEEEDFDHPPDPPPRGDSLSRSLLEQQVTSAFHTSYNNVDGQDGSDSESEHEEAPPQPPERPLPDTPCEEVPSLSFNNVSPAKERSQHESELRKRKRVEKKNKTMEKLNEMKKKQRESDDWQRRKRIRHARQYSRRTH